MPYRFNKRGLQHRRRILSLRSPLAFLIDKLIHKTEALKTMICCLSHPHNDLCCPAVDIPHQLHLLIPFLHIILIDTELVNSEDPEFILDTNPAKRTEEVLGDPDLPPVANDRLSSIRTAPCVGKSVKLDVLVR